MTNYKYQGISKDGAKVSGIVEAFNETDAVERIKHNCNVIVKLEEVNEGRKVSSVLSTEIGGNRLNIKEFTIMCSQFAIILHAGIPITRAVELIGRKMSDKKLKKILTEVSSDLQGGRALSSAFEERGKDVIPTLFIETMRAGEMSGNYEDAFQSMADHYEKQMKLGQKVRGALIYPIFLIIVAVAVVAILMVKVVPTFTSIFDAYGGQLPLITRMLIAISNFFKHFGLIIIAVIFLMVIAYQIYSHTEEGRLKCAKFALKLPAFGNINMLNAASQFSNNMAALLHAGIGITDAMRVTAKILSNAYISDEVGRMAGKLEEGNSLGECLRKKPILPDILIDMVNVGEETGELDDTLGTISKFYDNELEVAITTFISKLEPALLLFVAAIAGFIVLAVYIAMFEMYSIM